MRSKIAAVVAVAAILAACGGGAKPSEPVASQKPSRLTLTQAQRARIQVIAVTETVFQPTVQTTGTVAFNGDRSTQVLSPVSGPVTRLLVEPGARVSRGDPLATVSSPDFAAAVSAYRKALSTAQNLQRIADQDVQLFRTDAIARRDVDQAQTDAAAAVADRDAALAQIRALGIDPVTVSEVRSNPALQNVPAVIRAPIGGTVVERLITPGQLLQAGTTPAFTIADLATMWVMASVFESDLENVRKGEAASVASDVSPTPFAATVDYVGALVDPSTRATSVRLLVQNRSDLLKRDMFVRVGIHSERRTSGILVPADAVLRDEQNLPFVFVEARSPQSGYDRRPVVLGARVGDQYQIASGLVAGDRIVTDGALFLQFAESQ